MDSLNDLLNNRDLEEPLEIKLIKDYVYKHFKESVGVKMQPNQIVISVANAALAGSLRMHLVELKRLIKTDKRLSIYIGSNK